MIKKLSLLELHREQKGHLHIKSPLRLIELLTKEADDTCSGNRSLLITKILATHYGLLASD